MGSSWMWLCVVALGLAAGAVAAEEKTDDAKGGGIVHSVYFWLKDTATKEDAASLIAACQELGKLECVKRLEVGTPSPKSGGPVDGSYSVGLVVLFADQAAADTYNKHPQHVALIEKHKAMWQKVVVYDFLRK